MSLPWLNKVLLLLLTYFGGSVVEFWPATRETGVRFPANARTMFLKKYYCDGMLMQLSMCWTVFTQYSSHVVYWLGSGALTAMARVRFPAWKFFSNEIFQRTDWTILPKALKPTFQISGVDKLISPPHHYHDYYPVFLFQFDACLVYGQRHNTSKVTYTAITFFRKFFGTINPDSDGLSLETDFTNVKGRSKKVNLKLIEIKCEVLRITHKHNKGIYP